jgi:hypothetical protein
MQDSPEKVIQKYLREHPEVREILHRFLRSSAQYERALRAVASVLPPSTHLPQIAVRTGGPWRPIRG